MYSVDAFPCHFFRGTATEASPTVNRAAVAIAAAAATTSTAVNPANTFLCRPCPWVPASPRQNVVFHALAFLFSTPA